MSDDVQPAVLADFRTGNLSPGSRVHRSLFPLQQCTQTNEQECTTVNEQVCNTINEQQCSQVEEQQCSQTLEQECTTVQEEQCNTVNEQVRLVSYSSGQHAWISRPGANSAFDEWLRFFFS